jgi:glutathionylspermidine synthase
VQRITLPARTDWRARVEALGLTWHTAPDGQPYWDESAYWLFEPDEIDRIEAATAELYDMVLAAIAKVIDDGELGDFGYPPETIALIKSSWAARDRQPSLYARFDLAYDGRDLKLLELNADTPTSLLEASVVQWYWLEDRFPHLDQYNSIHEKLVAALRAIPSIPGGLLHFSSAAPHDEDQGTVAYMAACATEAGLASRYVAQQDIGWREAGGGFVDEDDQPIEALFKLIPWEWWLDDDFGSRLTADALDGRITVIEPAWKMVASNKRLLITLAQMYPNHPLLLPAAAQPDPAWPAYVRKPVRGREGANVEIVEAGHSVASTAGAYDDDLFVYQARAALAQADGRYAVLGSWVVGGQACGLGIRESDGPITGNLARFVPHVMAV